MRVIKYIIALVFGILVMSNSNEIKGQDVHFSENYATPLMINPAMTGIFNGGVRFAGVYRNQWSSITRDAPFTTIAASADFNTLSGAFANDQVGLGLMFYSDQAGDLNFATNHINLSFSYATTFGDRNNHFLSFGALGGFAQRSIDISLANAQFGDQYDGSGHNPTIVSPDFLALQSNNGINFADVGTGLLYYWAQERRYNLFFGIGVYHLNRPKINFINDVNIGDDRLQIKTSYQLGGRVPIGRSFALMPSFYFINQGPNNKLDAGTFLSYIFDTQRDFERSIGFGAFTRVGGDEYNTLGVDAIMAAVRVDLYELTVGLNYDFNISKLTAGTNGQGAIELAVIYVLQTQKRQKVLHCPRF